VPNVRAASFNRFSRVSPTSVALFGRLAMGAGLGVVRSDLS
jgi:hypothetical protein